MRGFWILTCFLIGFSAHAADQGKPAPELTCKLLNDEKFALKSSLGQVVMIHFWATWCDSCRKEMPALETFYKSHRKEGLRLIAVSMDTTQDVPKVREEMKKYSFSGAMAKDCNFKEYGRIWRLPLTFIVDRQGILREDGWDGGHGIDIETLEKNVTPLLSTLK